MSQQNKFSSGYWRRPSGTDQPTEWELMLQSLELTEDEAWHQLGIGGAKAPALHLWIEQNRSRRYIPAQFLTRRQRHGF